MPDTELDERERRWRLALGAEEASSGRCQFSVENE